MSPSDRAAALLNLEPGEGRGAGLMLAHSFAMGLATVFFETAASALFLAHFEKAALPYVYIAAALLNTLTGLVYSAALQRLPFGALMRGTLAFLLVSVLLLRSSLALSAAGSVYFALLVFYRILSALTDLEYWAVAGRLYDLRQAKRLFGVIGTGEVAARIAGAFSVPLLLRLLDVRNLLLLTVLALAACLWLLRRLLPLLSEPQPTAGRAPARGGLVRFGRLLGNDYLLSLFALVVFGVLAKYFVDYAFLSALKVRFADPAALASFFAMFSGASQVLSLVFRLFVSAPLLERHGIRFGLLVLPVAHVLCTLLILADNAAFGPMGIAFWLVVTNQGLYKVLKHPVDNPSFKVLYQPLRQDQRLAAQVAVETMVTPITTGLAGVIMLLFTVVIPYTPARFAAVMLLAFAGWLLVARRAGRAYSTALASALRGRIVHDGAFDWSDERSVAVLEETLKSERPDEVLFALDLIERSGHPRFSRDLVGLFTHPSAEVRRAALLRVEGARHLEAAPWVTRRVTEEAHPLAREAAVRALVAVGGAGAIPHLLDALASPAPPVRAAAAAGLLRLGGTQERAEALRRIREMAGDTVPTVRVAAARVLGDAGQDALHDQLALLLRDPVPEVRRVALQSAGRRADPALFPAMVIAVADPAVGGSAASALVGAGAAALPALETAFDASPELRAAIARILGRTRDERARRFLAARRNDPDPDVRGAALEALRAHGFTAPEEERPAIERELRREVEDAGATLGAHRDVSGAPGFGLLSQALESDVEGNRRRLFLLLSFLYDPKAVLRARDNLSHPARDRRAYAQELIEVTLSRETRELALPLLERLGPAERLERLEAQGPRARRPVDDRVRELLEQPGGSITGWTRAAAAYCAARSGTRALRERVAALARRGGSRLVRETADWAAGALGAPGFEKERNGMLTLERVIILKSVDMFEGASEQVLADIAAILEEVELDRGQVVFAKGDLGDSLYVIVDGRVRVLDGETVLGELGERDIFGELALLDPEPRSASVLTLAPTKLFRLDREAFSELMAANIEIVRGVLHVLCERLRQRNQSVLKGEAKSRTNAAGNPP